MTNRPKTKHAGEEEDPEPDLLSPLDRYQGAMLGLACGDALGTTLEFKRPDSFTPIDDIMGGGPFHLAAGEWTDDTSMALCLAESLIECEEFNPVDQLSRYWRWYTEGYWSSNGRCFDIGNTVRQALHEFDSTGEPWCGATHPMSAGNGSLMRLAPIPLAFATNPEQAIHYAGLSSKTTHGARESVDACRYFAGLVLGALRGASKEELLSSNFASEGVRWETQPLAPRIEDIASGSFKHKDPPDIRGTGYVVDCLEAALWAFARTDSFRDGALLAVNLGDDADTTGAVFGQIAGAFYGAGEIPADWRAKVALRREIEDIAGRLLNLDSIGAAHRGDA